MHDFYALLPFFLAFFATKIRLYSLICKWLGINQQTLSNPSTNELRLSAANKYYIADKNYNAQDPASLHYALKTGSNTVTIKPFESFGIAYNIPSGQQLRSSLATEQTTPIIRPEFEVDTNERAEYYNLCLF